MAIIRFESMAEIVGVSFNPVRLALMRDELSQRWWWDAERIMDFTEGLRGNVCLSKFLLETSPMLFHPDGLLNKDEHIKKQYGLTFMSTRSVLLYCFVWQARYCAVHLSKMKVERMQSFARDICAKVIWTLQMQN